MGDHLEILAVVAAMAAGVLLQLVVRRSAVTASPRRKMALDLAKSALLLGIQLLLMGAFSGRFSGHAGCIVASCGTFVIAVMTGFLQAAAKFPHSLSESQKMELKDL